MLQKRLVLALLSGAYFRRGLMSMGFLEGFRREGD